MISKINAYTCENLLNNLRGMFYRCKNDKEWTIEWVSSGCKQLTGYDRDELINNSVISFNDLVHIDDREWLWEKCSSNLKEMKVCNNEYRIVCRLGRIRWVREVANGIYDSEGLLLYVEGYIQEITCEKEQSLLALSFNSYQHAIDSGSIVSITDLNGVIVYCNDYFLEISKYSRSELVGQTHRVINSGFHPPEFFKEMWTTILNRSIWRGEVKNRAKDGSIYWVDAVISPVLNPEGHIVNFLSIRNLITDKKNKEIELIESEKFIKGILSSFSSNIAVIDKDGVIISTNDSWKSFSIDNNCPDLIITCEGANYFRVCEKAVASGDEIALKVLDGLNSILENKIELFQIEYPCHSDTVIRWFLLNATPLKGESYKIVIRHVDITKRKIAEQKLAESEQKYRAIIENSQELIISMDNNGVITFANKVWENILGYKEEELLGRKFLDLVNNEVRAKCTDFFNRIVNGETLQSVDSQLMAKDGELIYIEANSSPVFVEEQVVGVQMFARDVRVKRKMELEIKESENRLRKVFESVQDVIYTISSEGVFVSLNPAFEKLSGYKVEEWIGRPFSELVHPDDLPMAINTFNRIFRGENVDVYTLRLKNSSGEYRICELTPGAFIMDNKVVESLGLARDVTERIISEKKLKESEERFNLALKGANDGLWDWDLRSNKVYFSPRWKSMLGYDDHELENSFAVWLSLLHPDDVLTTKQKLNDFLCGIISDYHVEFRLKHKNGEYLDILSRGFLIKDLNGNNIRVVGTHLDMTELNIKKIQLQKLIDELNHKYNDLMQFNYIISHNLRTPVASILGLANILKYPDNSESDVRKIMDNIVISAQKTDEVLMDITNILSVREPLNAKKTDVVISEIVSGVLGMLKMQISKSKANINIEIADDCKSIKTIKAYLESIIYNLISNSIKYSSPDKNPEISLKVKKIYDMVHFTLTDNGIGIDIVKHKDKLFGLYKRFSGDVEGRGLGLFMTKMQVEAMGGKIFIDSVVGKGTTFTINFPS
ncbi:MAG: PAS domain S-box protein [Chitinophagaceae bacterium]|nr:PAS domain S-box protein [Chitinophagaceae bacterium]